MELQAMMHERNPYASSFKALVNIPANEVKDINFVLRKDKKPVK